MLVNTRMPNFMQPIIKLFHNNWLLQFSLLHKCQTTMLIVSTYPENSEKAATYSRSGWTAGYVFFYQTSQKWRNEETMPNFTIVNIEPVCRVKKLKSMTAKKYRNHKKTNNKWAVKSIGLKALPILGHATFSPHQFWALQFQAMPFFSLVKKQR